MDRYQLQAIRTCDLEFLRSDITQELKSRRQEKRLEKRLAMGDLKITPDEIQSSELELHNSSGIYSIPHIGARNVHNCARYLPALLAQDWSHIYKGFDEEKKYYVYAHVNPLKACFTATRNAGGNYGGLPFYIGKGTGTRAFDLKRNQGHGRILTEIQKEGIRPEKIVKIIFSDLHEAKALEIEAKLIYFFGSVYVLKTEKKKGLLYNLDLPPVPEFEAAMKEYPKIPRKDIHE
jgi:hypothetical protein